jgi:hypothetical protein
VLSQQLIFEAVRYFTKGLGMEVEVIHDEAETRFYKLLNTGQDSKRVI